MATIPTTITPGTGEWIWQNQYGDMSYSAQASSTQPNPYRFHADVGGSYVITVGGFIDSQFRIYNSSGTAVTQVINNGGFGTSETTSFTATADSWYYIEVAGVGTGTGIYTLSVNGPNLVRNTISLSSSTNAGSATGTVSPAGDIDYFAIAAPSGTTSLNLTVTPDAGSGLNTWVELYDNAGTRLQQITNGGNGSPDTASNIAVTAGATYWVGVSSALSAQAGGYTVSVDFGPDQSLPVVSIAPLSADKPEGNNQTTAFTFQVTRTGSTSGTSTVHWTVDFNQSPSANAADFSGGIIPSGDFTWGPGDTTSRTISVGVNGDLTYEGSLPEHFIVVLSGQTGATLGTSIANGSIQNDDADTSDPNDQISEAAALGAMTASRGVSGTIDTASDVDMFSFTVSAGQRILFDIDRPAGSQLNSNLRLFDANGAQLASSDNHSAPSELFSTTDSWFSYTFGNAGTYYIGVSNSGNTNYSATTGNGDGSGTTGTYNLELIGGSSIGGAAVDGTSVTIRRVDNPSASIDSTRATWVFVHGLNSNFDDAFNSTISSTGTTLYDQIRSQANGVQILAINWDAAASISLGAVESRIPNVANWAADQLIDLGFAASNLNFIGHSFGSYVSDEIAERFTSQLGEVRSIVALDPAANIIGGYDSVASVSFKNHSLWSWAFHDGDLVNQGNETTPTTAEEAFVVLGGGGIDLIAGHSAVTAVFANLLRDPSGAGGRDQYFQLSQLVDTQPGPWIPNSYASRGLQTTSGGYEAIISVTNSNVPSQITYLSTANRDPTGASLSASIVAENATNGTVIGTVRGQDPDAGETFSYSLQNNAGGRFAINASTGQISVASGSLLNFETATSHAITVRVTDHANRSIDVPFTLNVANVNEAPTGASLSASAVTENASNGTAIGKVTGQDPDSGAAFTYSLQNNAGGRFAISASTGQITVANGSLLDFETATSHVVTVRVTDQGNLTKDVNFTVNVTDVSETLNRPDLTVSNLAIAQASARPGQTITIDYDLNNIGSGGAAGFEVGFYISTDPTVDRNDQLFAYKPNASQLANSSTHLRGTAPLPDHLTPGLTYYIGVIADDTDVIPNEIRENNNVSNVVSITATANQAPVLTVPSANVAATAGQTFSAASLFSATDINGDTLSYYLYDATPTANSGHFVVNGTVVPAEVVYAVSAAQLALTSFVAGAAGTSDDLAVIAFDGHAYSGNDTFSHFHILV